MDHRTQIPALALLGLSFTGCPGDDSPSPVVGDWFVSEIDGQTLPIVDSYDSYTFEYGMEMTIEDDLAGQFGIYYQTDFGDYAARYTDGTDLVVDESAAPTYRIELVRDLLGFDPGYYYDTYAGPPGEDGSIRRGDGAPRPLAAPSRPDLAPAELVLTCTLDQDTLSCETDGERPVPIVFTRRKAPAGGG